MTAPTEFYSMVGSSALTCVERAPERRARRVIRVVEAQPEDILPSGTCQRCGFVGVHKTAEACIEALRSEIAALEFRLEKPAKPKGGAPADPLRERPPEPIPLSDAAGGFFRALDRGSRRRP